MSNFDLENLIHALYRRTNGNVSRYGNGAAYNISWILRSIRYKILPVGQSDMAISLIANIFMQKFEQE